MLPRRDDALLVLGLGLLALGSYLPWVRVTATNTVPSIYLPGMNSGLDFWGLIVLPLAVLTGVIRLWQPQRRWRRWVTAGTGLVASLCALTELHDFPSYGGSFAPGSGVYLTLLGSFAVLAASGYRLYVHSPGDEDTTPVSPNGSRSRRRRS